MCLIRGFDGAVAIARNARRHLITVVAVAATLAVSAGSTVNTSAASAATDAARASTEHVVTRGESLWSIAAAQLGQRASNGRIAATVTRLASINVGRLHHGRDLILPGQRLRLPRRASIGSLGGRHRVAGSKRVRDVQRMLRCAGYAAGPVDGRFGPATLAAVDRFQRAHRLAVDGIVGRHTLRALRHACRPARPARRSSVRPSSGGLRPAFADSARTHPLPVAPATRTDQPVTPAGHLWLWFACCVAAFAMGAIIVRRTAVVRPARRYSGASAVSDAASADADAPPLFSGAWGRAQDVPEIPLGPRDAGGSDAPEAHGPARSTRSANPVVQDDARNTKHRPSTSALAVAERVAEADASCNPATAGATVVVLATGQEANLLATLAGLPKGLAQVIVVDCTSLAGHLAAASRPPWGADVIRHRACGKGEALAVGLAHSRGEIVVVIDGSGLTDPAAISRLIGALRAGASFASGSRYVPGGTAGGGLMERVVDRGLSSLVNTLFDTDYTDVRLGFTAFWREDLADLRLRSADAEAAVLMNIQAAKAGLRVAEVPTFAAPRRAGAARNLRHGWRVLRAIMVERSSRAGTVAANGSTATPPDRADAPPAQSEPANGRIETAGRD